MRIAERGYARRTSRDARTTLTTALGDTIPRYIQAHPAQRKRATLRDNAGPNAANALRRRGRPRCKPCCLQSGAWHCLAAMRIKTERLGHEMPGMHRVYGHVSDAMRLELKGSLQERWDNALRKRAWISSHSRVSALDVLLEPGGDK
jgi:hypothetical protein